MGKQKLRAVEHYFGWLHSLASFGLIVKPLFFQVKLAPMRNADAMRAFSAARRAAQLAEPESLHSDAGQTKCDASLASVHCRPAFAVVKPLDCINARADARIAVRPGGESQRDQPTLQDAFRREVEGGKPVAEVNLAAAVLPMSHKLRTAATAIESLGFAVASLQCDCERQAEQPFFLSMTDTLSWQRQTIQVLNDLESKAIDAIRAVDQSSAPSARREAMDQRRKQVAPNAWRLVACKDSTPDMLNADSVEALVDTVKKVHAWCARQMSPALAQQVLILKKLRAVADQGEMAERSGMPSKVLKKAIKNQLDAVERGGTFLFNSLIPAGEIAAQRAGLLSHLAVERPKFELRLRGNAFRKAMRDALLAQYDSLLADFKAEEKAKQNAAGPTAAAPRDQRATEDERTAVGQIDDTATSITIARGGATPAARLPAPSQDRPARKKPIAQPPAASVRQPRYETLKTRQLQQLRRQEAERILDGIAEENVQTRIAVLEFYNAYSALRSDDTAGWKKHLTLLSDQRYQHPALRQMHAQLENDVLRHLADADRDPETEHMFSPTNPADDEQLHCSALLFLTEFRACKVSEANAAYFNYAAASLGDIVNQTVRRPLTDALKKRLLTGREIVALEGGAHAIAPAPTARHGDAMQPEIRLAEDGLQIEIIDTSHTGSKLYFPANGFKTSVARAAELLAAAAIGATRSPAMPGRSVSRPSTPTSAAWLASLACLAPRLIRQAVPIAPFAEGALLATIKPPG